MKDAQRITSDSRGQALVLRHPEEADKDKCADDGKVDTSSVQAANIAISASIYGEELGTDQPYQERKVVHVDVDDL